MQIVPCVRKVVRLSLCFYVMFSLSMETSPTSAFSVKNLHLTIETLKYHLKQHKKVSPNNTTDGAELEDSNNETGNKSAAIGEDVETVVVKVEGGCKDSTRKTLSDTDLWDEHMNSKPEDEIVEDDSNADPLTPLLRAQVNPEINLERTSEESTEELGKQLSPDV